MHRQNRQTIFSPIDSKLSGSEEKAMLSLITLALNPAEWFNPEEEQKRKNQQPKNQQELNKVALRDLAKLIVRFGDKTDPLFILNRFVFLHGTCYPRFPQLVQIFLEYFPKLKEKVNMTQPINSEVEGLLKEFKILMQKEKLAFSKELAGIQQSIEEAKKVFAEGDIDRANALCGTCENNLTESGINLPRHNIMVVQKLRRQLEELQKEINGEDSDNDQAPPSGCFTLGCGGKRNK
jgi:hypothetical protein